MRPKPALFPLLLVALTACKPSEQARSKARELSRAARATILANPYNGDSLTSAKLALQAAARLSPDEAWVHIGRGYLARAQGHGDGGSWYKAERFQPQLLAVARSEAAFAVAADPKEPIAWCLQSWIDALDGRYDKVQDDINRAHDLDSSLFEPYQTRAVVMQRTRHYEQAEIFARAADTHATEPWQKHMARQELATLAHVRNDRIEELRLLVLNAQDESDNGWTQASVAEWYMAEKRYAEAIPWWEKAVSLAPFRRAVEQLAKAREAVKTGVLPTP
jgi:tetratricopeptide (TPR) repeat protein